MAEKFDENFDPTAFGRTDPLTANQADNQFGAQVTPAPDLQFGLPQQFQGGQTLTPSGGNPFDTSEFFSPSQPNTNLVPPVDITGAIPNIPQVENAPGIGFGEASMRQHQERARDKFIADTLSPQATIPQAAPIPDVFKQKPQITEQQKQAMEIVQAMGGQGVQPQAQSAGALLQDMSQQGLPAAKQTSTFLTPEEQARQNAVIARVDSGQAGRVQPKDNKQIDRADREQIATLGGSPEAEKLVREARQQEIIKRSGSTQAARKLRESLTEQGVSKDVLDKATEGKSTYEQFKSLNRLQLKRTRDAVGTAAADRITKRLENKSRTSKSGIPNDAQQALNMQTFLETTQEGNEKSYEEYLTPAEKKRLTRYKTEAANGPIPDRKHDEAERIRKKAVTRSDEDVKKQQKELASDELSRKIASAQSDQERKFYLNLKERRTAIRERLDGSFTRTEKKKGGLKDQLQKELNDMSTAVYQAPPQPDAQGRNQSPVQQGDTPPVEGARKAPDGKWYVVRSGQMFEVS